MITSLKYNIKNSIRDSVLYSFMVGLSESFLCAFILYMGVSDIWAGVLSVVPMVLGSILQLSSPYFLRKFGTYKKWVVFAVCFQGLMYLPLAVIAHQKSMSLLIIFLIISCYWGFGMSASSSWNGWIGLIIPIHVRKKFFSLRGQFSQIFILIGLFTAGIILDWGRSHHLETWIFSILFFVGFLFRVTSGFFLSRQSDYPVPTNLQCEINLRNFIKEIIFTRAGKIFLFMLFFQLTVQISSPFFSPFMLSYLQMDYKHYMILIAFALATKAIAYTFLGTFLRGISHRNLLLMGVLGIAPLPILWACSQSFAWLCMTQIISGFFWAVYELSTLLFIMKNYNEEKRTVVLAHFNLFNNFLLLIGTMIGVGILMQPGSSYMNYMTLFIISGSLRLLAVIFLVSSINLLKKKPALFT